MNTTPTKTSNNAQDPMDEKRWGKSGRRRGCCLEGKPPVGTNLRINVYIIDNLSLQAFVSKKDRKQHQTTTKQWRNEHVNYYTSQTTSNLIHFHQHHHASKHGQIFLNFPKTQHAENHSAKDGASSLRKQPEAEGLKNGILRREEAMGGFVRKYQGDYIYSQVMWGIFASYVGIIINHCLSYKETLLNQPGFNGN